jgi:hypothetical protein
MNLKITKMERQKDEIYVRGIRLMGGFQDTRNNDEDLAITPYIFRVKMVKSYRISNEDVSIKIFGLGICWGYYAVYLALGFNIPSTYQLFNIHRKQ